MKLRSLAPSEPRLLLEALGDELRVLLGELQRAPKPVASSEATPPERSPPVLDLGAFLLWTLSGVRLFYRPEIPPSQSVTSESRRVILLVARIRYRGNITRMATALGTSRRAVRESMKRLGLYGPADSSTSGTDGDRRPDGEQPPPKGGGDAEPDSGQATTDGSQA